LSVKHPERVKTMAKEWFRIAKELCRENGKRLTPPGNKLKELNFRKSPGSGKKRKKEKK